MKKVLILFGGNSFEHNVSCLSATSILENIDRTKFEVTSVVISKNNEWYLYQDSINHLITWETANIKKIDNIIDFVKSFDIVFPVLHGANGEDGRLQGMLDLFNIKYVGCKTLTSALCMDKVFSKYIFNYLDIPQIPFVGVTEDITLKDIIKTLDFPMIVKPANGGSSIGISKVNNKRELKKAIIEAFNYDKKVLVEKFITARELECAVIYDKGIIISSIGEIKAANEFYDYNAKYENEESYTIVPADLNTNIEEEIKNYAERAFVGVNASSLARIDFLYDEINNKVYLNEINTLPGFTTISMYPSLFINDGYTYTDIITTLIDNA